MIAEHYARRWQRAGLIDGAIAERIRAWEAAHRRPVMLWATAGTGALAICLGIMAIVSANWEEIPAWLKLAVNFGLIALAAGSVFLFWRRERIWLREISALLLSVLVLSGIALIGQVYQLQSAPWRALVLWLALTTPFLALTAFSRLNGVLWAVAAAVTWFMADDPLGDLSVALGVLPPPDPYRQSALLTPLMSYVLACLLIVVGALRSQWSAAESQGALLLRLSVAGLIAASSIGVSIGWLRQPSPAAGPIIAAALATLPAAIALWANPIAIDRRIVVAFLAASLFVWTAGMLMSGDHGLVGDLSRAVLFIVYWAAIGAIAAHLGWRGWFGFAFTMIGLRLLILYFEAIGGLTATGLGLIVGGMLCFGLAALGWRLMRRVGSRAAGEAA
jgi:hypothetical protein